LHITVRLAVRDWEYLTPLALGDIRSERLDLKIDRVGTLVSNIGTDPQYDVAEISFSRYAGGRAKGEMDVLGIPNFVMRGFRHRCIITVKDSPITRLEQLAGKKIGVTGWRDSGNTWTRAALAHAGVGIEDAYWFAGRLTEAHPIVDRLDGFGRAGRIEAAPGERPMMELLETGELDAIFTPFMPDSFFGTNSNLRHVLPDFRAEELAYFREVGYVPGMHLLGVKASLAGEHPWLARELSDLLDESQRVWLSKRRKYADTTPWIIEELGHVARDLPAGWNESGFAANERMIADFAEQLHGQGLTPMLLTPTDLFPFETSHSSKMGRVGVPA
jgi:4,5-dihydroxyphthalate decarboxylase